MIGLNVKKQLVQHQVVVILIKKNGNFLCQKDKVKEDKLFCVTFSIQDLLNKLDNLQRFNAQNDGF